MKLRGLIVAGATKKQEKFPPDFREDLQRQFDPPAQPASIDQRLLNTCMHIYEQSMTEVSDVWLHPAMFSRLMRDLNQRARVFVPGAMPSLTSSITRMVMPYGELTVHVGPAPGNHGPISPWVRPAHEVVVVKYRDTSNYVVEALLP